MNRFSSLLTLVTIVFSLAHLANAQDLDSVTITGKVTDQNGAIVPGAEIKVITRTGLKRTVTTNNEGQYKLVQLEPGNYVIQVTFAGFAPYELTSLSALSGQTLDHDVILFPANIEVTTVTVSASNVATIDSKRTLVGVTLNTKQTELLPVASRSVLDLIFTLPGVTEEPLATRDLAEDRDSTPNQTPEEAGTFSLAGAPAYSNNITIDGLDNNDDRAARERFQPPLDAVEEVQVITNQFSAEYGRASGGRINLRTKSGSSQFGGRGFYFFRDEALNANSYRNNSRGLPRLPLQDHTGGFSLSGPVRIPNIVSSLFFVAYERNKTLDSAFIDTLLPTRSNPAFPLPLPNRLNSARIEFADEPALAAEVAPYVESISTPLENTAITTRVDHQLNELHNIAFVYQRGRLINLRQFGGGSRLAESLQGRRRSSDSLSISDTYVISSSAVNQARFQISRLAPSFKTSATGPVALIAIKDALEDDDPAHRSGTIVAGSSTSGGSDRREVRHQLQDVLSLVQQDHSLKLGADFHYVRSAFIDLVDASGTFNFASAGDFLAGLATRFRQSFGNESVQKNRYTGLFIHDEWQLLPQLLISYGVRYESESILRDRNNFGPRFSLAYSPLDSGKLVLRFGSGIFYNRALLRTIDDFTLGRQQLSFDTNSLVDPATGKVMTAAQRRMFIEANLQFPRILSADDPLVRKFATTNNEFSRRLDPALRIPESYQTNLGIECDLGAGFALEANLTFTRGIHLWREFNANAPRLPSQYKNFSEFLASRDFPNFFQPSSGARPLYNASSAGELVRFTYSDATSIGRLVEFGVPVSVFNLNHPTSTTVIDVALAALAGLRPDPSRTEVEQLISTGNSFYRGLTLELSRRFNFNSSNTGFTFRAGYTLSKLIDDGVVNTSDALTPGDFRSERARSLSDRRHRFVFSGTFSLPGYFGGLQLSPLLRLASCAPFNISIGGADRNLDDVGNDRPNYNGDLSKLRWRGPGSSMDSSVAESFSQPVVGQTGNLPRNAGRGPGLFLFDLSVTREFRISERVRVRPVVEFDNVLNKTVFSFGAEFVDFNALSATATPEQRQSFLDSFLLATRTLRPRQIRLGIRMDF
jgi:hypothetical protein